MKTPSTNHLAIINSHAGGGSCGRHAAHWLDRLRQSGLNIDVFETRAHGDARGYARKLFSEGRRDFISFGGDGTAFEIVNGLLERPAAGDRPRLGIIPLGTGNSFLRQFSDRGAENTIEALRANRHQTCDVCCVTHATGVLHYLTIFGIGFVADVGARRNRQFSSLGELGYTLSTLVQLVGLRSHIIPVRFFEDDTFNREAVIFVAFNNTRFTGGRMLMAPSASLQDGLLDVISLRPIGRIALLRTFPKIFTGAHVTHPAVSYRQAASVDIEVDVAIDVLIDGEMIKITPRRVDVVPGAIDVAA